MDEVKTKTGEVQVGIVGTGNPNSFTEAMNQILDEADKAPEGIDPIVANEAASAAVYGKYYFADLEKYIENVDGVSFLEAGNMISGLKSSIHTLESVKIDLDSLYERDPEAPIVPDPETGKFVDSSNLAAEVASKNILAQDAELAEDANSFYGNYDRNIALMNKLIDLLQKKIDDAEGHNSTKYINDEMVSMLEKKLRLLDPTKPNYSFYQKRYKNILDAFANRTDLGYLTQKVSIMVKNKAFLRDLKKELADYSFTHLKGLKRIANADKLRNAEFYLGCTMFDSTAGAAMMVILNKIALGEVNSGKDAWVKVFLLNFVDICKGFFDIGDANEYMNAISENIRPIIVDAIKPLKIKPVTLAGAVTKLAPTPPSGGIPGGLPTFNGPAVPDETVRVSERTIPSAVKTEITDQTPESKRLGRGSTKSIMYYIPDDEINPNPPPMTDEDWEDALTPDSNDEDADNTAATSEASEE